MRKHMKEKVLCRKYHRKDYKKSPWYAMDLLWNYWETGVWKEL